MSFINANHPPSITGISLIIDSEDGTTQSLEFHKAKTRVVNIGRKSGPAKELFTADCDKALFKCPVISRKHAKITFTEYGNVYITDLDSHHGTHLLKPGEAVHRMLTPEVPNFISDGDVITFGKTVGKDQSLVRPVSVRVKMQYVPHLTPTARPAEPVRDLTVISDSSDEASPKSSPKSSTGRYGVFPPSPDQNSSSSDGESDMEVSPPPPDKSQERPVCGGYESRLISSSRLLTSYFSLPKQRPLPPIIIAPSPPLSPSRAWEEDPESEVEIEDGQSDAYSPTSSPPHPPCDGVLDKFTVPWSIPPFPANLFDIQRIVDKSHTRPEDDALHHMVLGAYGFDDDMRHVQFPGLPMPQASSSRTEGLASLPHESVAPIPPLLPSTALMPPMFGAMPLPVDLAPETTAGPTSEVEETMSSSQTNVPLASAAPATTNEAPLERNSQVPDAIPSSEIESHDAPRGDQIVNAEPIVNSTPEVTEQQDNTDTVMADENHTTECPLVSVASGDTYSETDDQEKDSVVDPTTATVIHKQAEGDIAMDVAAIKSARAEVEQLVSQLKAQVMAQAVCSVPTSVISGNTNCDQSTSSLKRKRDDVESIDEEQAPLHAGTQGVSAIDIPRPAIRGTKRRRTMKVISVVAQTTAIAAIGAVAAWSALAYA